MPVNIDLDVAKIIRESIKNPIVAIKIIAFLIIGLIMAVTAYYGAQSSPYFVSMLNSILGVSVVFSVAIAFMYLDLFRFGK